MMNRRAFSALLSMLPVAGAAKVPAGLTDVGLVAGAGAAAQSLVDERETVTHASDPDHSWAAKHLEQLLNPNHLEERYNRFLIEQSLGSFVDHGLDPDLRDNKSFSAVTKARIQRDRTFVRYINRERFDMFREVGGKR